jgi:biofilm PGA synthesis lipoprotein PgaB
MAKGAPSGEQVSVLAHRVYLDSKGRGETEREYKARIKADLRLAEERLNTELGKQPHLLAYPYGHYNKSVVEVGEELGIELYFTVEEGINNIANKQVFRLNTGAPGTTAAMLLDKLGHYYEYNNLGL